MLKLYKNCKRFKIKKIILAKMYKETYKSMQQKEAYIKQYKKKEFKVHKNLNNYWQNINNQLKNQIQMIN